MWDRPKFEKIADIIAEEYLTNGRVTSIDDLSLKVASENSLNPEQIRTMVRLANVATFQRVFDKKGSNNDDMVEFEPGDPEIVIQKLYANAKTAAETSMSNWDNTARAQDLYGDLYPKKQVMEKVAHEIPTADIDVNELKLLIKRADNQLTIDAYRAEFKWQEAMEKAANIYRLHYSKLHGMNVAKHLPNFEKDALVSLGEDIEPELRYFSDNIGGRSIESPLYNGEKVSHILDRHVVVPNKNLNSIFMFMKQAREARYTLKECTDARNQLISQMGRANAIK